jgi:hypothetical protein
MEQERGIQTDGLAENELCLAAVLTGQRPCVNALPMHLFRCESIAV